MPLNKETKPNDTMQNYPLNLPVIDLTSFDRGGGSIYMAYLDKNSLSGSHLSTGLIVGFSSYNVTWTRITRHIQVFNWLKSLLLDWSLRQNQPYKSTESLRKNILLFSLKVCLEILFLSMIPENGFFLNMEIKSDTFHDLVLAKARST